MAQPASEAREALIGLTEITRDEMRVIFAELARQGLTAEQARDALLDLLPSLGTEYHLAASALGADWFDSLRDSAEVGGAFRADPVDPPGRARWEALARWGVDPLFAAEPDWAAALSLVAGGMQRTVADGHRLTVTENSLRDPRAAGWKRVGDGSSCAFCRMLIGRGFVYSESSVTFKSHDNCGCAAAPEWGADSPVAIGVPYVASKRRTTERDRQRVREYLASQS